MIIPLTKKKYFTAGDLFYPAKGVAGYAQVPHFFDRHQIDLLNAVYLIGTKDAEGQYSIHPYRDVAKLSDVYFKMYRKHKRERH